MLLSLTTAFRFPQKAFEGAAEFKCWVTVAISEIWPKRTRASRANACAIRKLARDKITVSQSRGGTQMHR